MAATRVDPSIDISDTILLAQRHAGSKVPTNAVIGKVENCSKSPCPVMRLTRTRHDRNVSRTNATSAILRSTEKSATMMLKRGGGSLLKDELLVHG